MINALYTKKVQPHYRQISYSVRTFPPGFVVHNYVQSFVNVKNYILELIMIFLDNTKGAVMF